MDVENEDELSLASPRKAVSAWDEMKQEMAALWARTTRTERGYEIPVVRLGLYACAGLSSAIAYTLARIMLLRNDSVTMAAMAGAVILVAAALPLICRAAVRHIHADVLTEGTELAVMMFAFMASGVPLIAVMIPVVILSIAAAASRQIAGMWGFLFLLWLTGE